MYLHQSWQSPHVNEGLLLPTTAQAHALSPAWLSLMQMKDCVCTITSDPSLGHRGSDPSLAWVGEASGSSRIH
jgi:hypothetical protein